jgi:dihydrofolate reductase
MLSIIVATDSNDGIGYRGDLLFKIPQDMKRFKELTTGKSIIMGRKTYESLPNGALPNRHNIVLTRDENLFIDYSKYNDIITVIYDPNILIDMYKDSEKEVFIIGGGEIYKQFLPYCNKIYLTKVIGNYDADTHFKINPDEWIKEWESSIIEFGLYTYNFINLIRKDTSALLSE